MENVYLVYTIKIALFALFLIVIFAYIIITKSFEKSLYNKDLKAFFLILPGFLVVGSNFLYLAFSPDDLNIIFNDLVIYQIVTTFFTVFIEELLFRHLLIESMEKYSSFKKLLISSLIFGLAHITTFISTLNPIDLIQMVYSFGIGLIFGLFYIYAKMIIPTILMHLFFNVLNGIIFGRICDVTNQGIFVLVNVVVGVVFVAYYLLIYFVYLRKHSLLNC